MNDLNLKYNSEGYSDPTAYYTFKNLSDDEDERFHKLLNTIFYICKLAGFEVTNRIILTDKKTGRVWK